MPHERKGLVRTAADEHKVEFARRQRREPTRSECRLWAELRGSRLALSFRRQHPIGDYVLDFFCSENRLAVEIDGPVHDKQEGYDKYRDGWLAEQGIRVLRVPDEDVAKDIDGVLGRIREALRERRRAEQRPHPPAPLSLAP